MKVVTLNIQNLFLISEYLVIYTFILKFKKILICYFFCLLLNSCKFYGFDSEDEPKGFDNISQDGASYFVYVDEKIRGDRLKQLTYGSNLCIETYKEINYCEVYYFADRKDVPKTFPIVNRIRPIGLFELKYGKRKLKMLSGEREIGSRTVFIKKHSKRGSILKSINNNK